MAVSFKRRRLGSLLCALVAVPGQAHGCREGVEVEVEDLDARFRVAVRRYLKGYREGSVWMEDERLGNLAEGVLGLEGRQELALRPPDAADSRVQAFSRRTVGNFRWLLDAFARQVVGLREELRVRLCLL